TVAVADIGLTSFKGRMPLLCGRERSGSHNAEKAERKRPGLRNTVSTRHTTGRRETYTVVTDIGLYAPSLWLYEDKAQQLPGLLGGNCPLLTLLWSFQAETPTFRCPLNGSGAHPAQVPSTR